MTMSDDLYKNEIYTVGQMSSGGSGASALEELNDIFAGIQADLNSLSSRIGKLGNKSAIIRKYVPLYAPSAGYMFVGALVYYDPTKAMFDKALAKLEADTWGADGETLEAPSSRVEGIVIELDAPPDSYDETSPILGTILCGGYYESVDAMTNCIDRSSSLDPQALSTNGTAGTYYLSPFTPGRATKYTGRHLRQPVFTYYGKSTANMEQFSLNLFYLAHDNHFHAALQLNNAWTAIPEGSTDFPAGWTWWYDGSDNASYVNMGTMSAVTTAVFYNGMLQNITSSSTFRIENGVLGCTAENAPEPGSVTVFNSFPLSYENPVIRAVEAVPDTGVEVTSHNGLALIKGKAFEEGTTEPKPSAITSIVGNRCNRTPVISGLRQGIGIDIHQNALGEATISAASRFNVLLDAYSVDHKGTNITSNDQHLFITFPKGRAGSMFIMSLPVPDVDDDSVIRAYPWIMCYGPGAYFKASIYFVEQPPIGQSVQVSDTPIQVSTLSVGGAAAEITYGEFLPGTFTGKGWLTAVIGLATEGGAPSADVSLMRVGFRLVDVNAAPADVYTENVKKMNMLVGYATSGEALGAGVPVMINSNGALVACSSAYAANVSTCIGITKEAYSAGVQVEYVISGAIEIPNSSYDTGSKVYISSSGDLTTNNPAEDASAMFIQSVGVALSSSLVQVNIGQGVLKA